MSNKTGNYLQGTLSEREVRIADSSLPLNTSLLILEMILKSLSGVMMAVILPNMLPTPRSKSMMKYSTDHSWGNGILIIASLYIMKARPGPSAAWKTLHDIKQTSW